MIEKHLRNQQRLDMLSFDIRKHEVSKVSTSLNILGLWLLTSLKICQSSY